MFKFAGISSALASFDAISKLFWLVMVGVISFTQPPFVSLSLYMVILLMALTMGRIPARRLLPAIVLTLVLGLFFLMGGFFFPGGKVLFEIGGLRYTWEGFVSRGTYAFRVMNVMLASILFIWVTNPRDFVAGLMELGIPYRIAYTVFVGLNYIPALTNEMIYIRDAQRLRGVQSSRSPIGFIRRYLAFLLAVLLRALRKAQITAYALDSKGFGAYEDRTNVKEFHWSAWGILHALLWMLITAGLIYAKYGLRLWQGLGWTLPA